MTQPDPVAREATQLRILIVDDESIVLESIKATLELDGHTIVTARGGEAGIETFQAALLAQQPFNVVITDLGMPGADGRHVARAVKRTSPATPVLMLTGWDERLASAVGIPANIDRILSKPPALRELRAALAQVCRADPTG